MNNNPDAFCFKDLKGQTLIKLPGSISNQVFNMKNLNACKVYILDISEDIYVDNCVSCEFYVAPVKGSFVMRHSQNSTCSVACRKFSVKNCTNFTFYLYCPSDPHIESSFDIKFAPYNFSYPQQDKDFKKAGFDPSNNRWCKVSDQSPSTGVHFSLLPTNMFKKSERMIEGYGVPINPVPIPQQYGGTLKTEIIPGSSRSPTSEVVSSRQSHLLPPTLSKTEDNSHSVTQKEIIEDEKSISIFYSPSAGYQLTRNQLPAGFSFNEFLSIIDLFNEITENYYTQWAEYIFAMFLTLIGFFTIILIMSLLKMSSEWEVEALGLFLVILLASLALILVIIFVLKRRYEKVWMEKITEIANQKNQEFFEGKNSKITAGLTVITITLP